jgi:hypothetical protein
LTEKTDYRFQKGERRMNKGIRDLALIIALIIISLTLYATHLLLFHDINHVVKFALGDLAFVPVEVIFVTMIFHRMLTNNEKKKKIGKLYMVIEIFFSQLGTELLRVFACSDITPGNIKKELIRKDDWNDKSFKELNKTIEAYCPEIEIGEDGLEAIDMMLQECRPNLLSLLENPTLLEHETFTEVLMSVFHLADELRMRFSFASLNPLDHAHLVDDVKRAYKLLAAEWVNYVNHTRVHYPYLYSLTVRNNPFSENAEVEINA